MGVVGIDLAGSERRDSGYCCINKKSIEISILHSDEEIIDRLQSHDPKIIAIDAPLSLPKGRKSIDIRDDRHFRGCDIELRRLGIRFFPITLGPMRMLTKRGMALKRKIKKILPDSEVIEVYPGATYDILGARRKDPKSILMLFKKFKIRLIRKDFTQDELDGICCALTAELYEKGKAGAIGDPKEGRIVIPMV